MKEQKLISVMWQRKGARWSSQETSSHMQTQYARPNKGLLH